MASSVDNLPMYVADLTVDPVTKQVDFSNSVPILPQIADTSELRESMKQLLDIILGFFEEEMRQLNSGDLKEEDELLPVVQDQDL